MIFTVSAISAPEVLNLDLLSQVVVHEELMPQTILLVQIITNKAQHAIKYVKIVINRGCESDLETAMMPEKDLFGLCFATADQKEGMAAFIEKRSVKLFNK